jgi:hypothetical protein
MAGSESQSPPEADEFRTYGLSGAITAALAEFVRLLMQHWALAQAEMADGGASFALAALFTMAALLVALLGLTLMLAGAALALAVVVPVWLAFLLVGGATALAAGGLLLLARRQSRRSTLLPRRAMASLRRNIADLGSQLP